MGCRLRNFGSVEPRLIGAASLATILCHKSWSKAGSVVEARRVYSVALLVLLGVVVFVVADKVVALALEVVLVGVVALELASAAVVVGGQGPVQSNSLEVRLFRNIVIKSSSRSI